jgi:hypothetical protein
LDPHPPKVIAAVDKDADEWDRWLVDGKLSEESANKLRSRFAAPKAALEARPLKSADKLDRQIAAYLTKDFDRMILERSFNDPKSPAETLALVRSSLPFFTPARAKSRRVRLWDIEPVREHLLRWKRAAEAAKKM